MAAHNPAAMRGPLTFDDGLAMRPELADLCTAIGRVPTVQSSRDEVPSGTAVAVTHAGGCPAATADPLEPAGLVASAAANLLYGDLRWWLTMQGWLMSLLTIRSGRCGIISMR